MYKTVTFLAIALFLMPLLTGCATIPMSALPSGLIANVKGPVTATALPTYSKVGTAFCTSVLGIVATGDASIEAAARNGGITKIHHVDFERTSVFGLFATYRIYVYGE